jgi:multiple sugar transport system ATP-binding protein
VTDGNINLGNTKVRLADFASDAVAAGLEGKEIAFGFRPEHVVLYNGEKPANSVGVGCTVELTELLGDNTNVYIDIDGVASILKIDPHQTPETDSRISFAIPYDHIYLFDAETERVIDKK